MSTSLVSGCTPGDSIQQISGAAALAAPPLIPFVCLQTTPNSNMLCVCVCVHMRKTSSEEVRFLLLIHQLPLSADQCNTNTFIGI